MGKNFILFKLYYETRSSYTGLQNRESVKTWTKWLFSGRLSKKRNG